METAAEVITSALLELEAIEVETGIEASEMQTGINYLNRMMSAYAVKGIDLGFTKITNQSDYVTVTDGALEGIIFNLALKLAPQFGASPSQMLYENAKDGRKDLFRLSVKVIPTKYPANLPRGSGHSGRFNNSFYDDQFYPDVNTKPSFDLSMASNTTETVISVVDTAVQVLGTFVVGESNLFTCNTAGLCIYDKKTAEQLSISATFRILSVTGDVTVNAHIAVNGAVVASTGMACNDANAVSKSLLHEQAITYKDTITVYVDNATDTTNLIVSDCVLQVSQ